MCLNRYYINTYGNKLKEGHNERRVGYLQKYRTYENEIEILQLKIKICDKNSPSQHNSILQTAMERLENMQMGEKRVGKSEQNLDHLSAILLTHMSNLRPRGEERERLGRKMLK